MANVNAPTGFRPIGTIGQAGYTGKLSSYTVVVGDTSAIGIGDPVCLAASSANASGLATARRATVGDALIGVCVGVKPTPADLTLTYRKASTAMEIYVDTDPDTIYEIQEDADAGAVPATAIGLNADFILGTVDTVTGNGKTMLDSSSVETTTTLGLQILRASSDPKNELGVAYQRFVVLLNNNRYRGNSVLGIS
jgi:hypothetical protein